MILKMFSYMNEDNVVMYGTVDIVCEIERKKRIIVVPMEVGSFGFHGVVNELF